MRYYARDPQVATYPPPDVSIERIGDLRNCNLPVLLQAARAEGKP